MALHRAALYIITLARVTAPPVGFAGMVVPKDNPIEWGRTPTKHRLLNDLTSMLFRGIRIQLINYRWQLLHFVAILRTRGER